MPDIDREPDYVKDRTEGPQNLGRIYLLSLSLCAGLVATTAFEAQSEWPDIMSVTSSVTKAQMNQRINDKSSITFCSDGEKPAHDIRKASLWREFDI
ncbi:hypothetical protein HB779_22505 (plasmid) [Phyllobacterium sp. 628]|uniref:hypothetical protein n=1 Tax=Phyllobacterium sp. 628 TaxID=2718938 RepID=UPI0016624AC7|nr:hypothetical protein [Phyllobacterium sp. 628]QND54664.1 hypothetical protein HB779_22505 [Phyllobacterium sp. 628]